MSPVKCADAHESRLQHRDQEQIISAVPSMTAGVGPGLQMTGVEKTETDTAGTPPIHPPRGSPTPTATMASESSQVPSAGTFQRPASWGSLPLDLPSNPSTQHKSAQAGASPLTSSVPMPRDPATLSKNTTIPPKSTFTAETTIKCTGLSMVQALEDEDGEEEINIPRLSSQCQTQRSNSLKRRVSISPKKSNTSCFEPLTIRTDIQIPTQAPPSKRSRTENSVEVSHDANGSPITKEPPDCARAGFNPSSAMFGPLLTRPADFIRPLSALMPAQNVLATRLLTGKEAKLAAPIQKKQNFSFLQAFIDDQALCLLLVSYLPFPSLLDIYAISKPFHNMVNKNATAFILSSMRTWAPNADQIFPWRCYQPLCIKDPVKKQKDKPAIVGADIYQLEEPSRDVPSLRWLQMVVWREGIVRDMTVVLAVKMLLTPTGTRDAIKRMWFILDLPSNAHRLALIRSERYIPNKVIYLATHFFIKCDMAFTDPGLEVYPANHPNQTQYPQRWAHGAAVGCNLREKLIAERTFVPLWRVLRGWTWYPDAAFRPMTKADIFHLWARHRAVMPFTAPEAIHNETVMGMKVGPTPVVGYERVYNPAEDENLTDEERDAAIAVMPKNPYQPQPLLRPDELLMGEGLRRELKQHLWWVEMMLWGSVSPNGGTVRARTEEQILAIGTETNGRGPGSAGSTERES